MCAVSVISDHYGQYTAPPYQFYTQPFDWTKALEQQRESKWDREAFEMLKELIERTKKLDAKLGLPDCEDPKKAEWMADIERRVKALEDEKGGK